MEAKWHAQTLTQLQQVDQCARPAYRNIPQHTALHTAQYTTIYHNIPLFITRYTASHVPQYTTLHYTIIYGITYRNIPRYTALHTSIYRTIPQLYTYHNIPHYIP